MCVLLLLEAIGKGYSVYVRKRKYVCRSKLRYENEGIGVDIDQERLVMFEMDGKNLQAGTAQERSIYLTVRQLCCQPAGLRSAAKTV